MTISSTTRKAGPFQGNGISTVFAFDFRVFDKTDVQVVLTSANSVDVALTLDSDYSVTLNADQLNSPGGIVTYPLTGSPLPDAAKLTVTGSLQNLQETDITNQGGFYPDVIEAMVDRATIQIQQLAEEVSRSIRVSVSDPSIGLQLANSAARAGTMLGFDGSGNLVSLPIPASIGAGDLRDETFVDGTDFTAGASTYLVLSRAYGNVANLSIHFDAAFQGPDQIQSLIGNVLTFTGPIPLGVQKIYVKGGTTLSLDVPPLESVIDAMLADGSKVRARVDNILDVRDFPMIGGSYQDDTTAVEAAFNLALETGRPVQLPFDRDVYITRPIELKPRSAPTTWTGEVGIHTSCANAILLRGQGGRAIKAAPNFVGDHMLQLIFDSTNGWIAPMWSGMEDFILDGAGIVDTGLISNYCMNVQLRRMRMTGLGNGVRWIGYGVASIERCEFFVGTAIDFSQGGGDSFIQTCDFYPTFRGVVIGPSGANFSLRDCVFTRQDADFPVGSAPIAIASTITTTEIRDLRVRNCEFSGMQYGVSFAGSGGPTIKRIAIEGCHTTPSAGGALWTGALAYLENVQEGDITGNFVGYPGNPPTNGTPLAGVSLVSSKNVGVRGNQFSYLTGPSVNGTNCSGLNISDNRLNNVAMAGSGNTAIYLNSVTNSVVSLNSAQKTEASAGATFIAEIGTSTANKGVGNVPSGFTTFASLAGGSTSSYS